MLKRDYVLNALQEWVPLGTRTLPNGTELIGQAPHIGAAAWLHKVFAGLVDDEMSQLVRTLPNIGSFQYQKYLFQFNGLNLFSSNLFLYGMRTSYKRDGSIFQPFDVCTHFNEQVTGAGLPPDWLLIGGSNSIEDGICFSESPDGRIFAYEQDYFDKFLFEWPNFEVFLSSELSRVARYFDSEGKVTDIECLSKFEIVVNY